MISHQAVDRTRHRLSARDLALVASFAALIAVLGLTGAFLLPGNPVPVTLQTLGVMLAGSILGWKRGALSVIVLLLVAAGLPLLSGGRTTIVGFAGPGAGYLVGWVFGAAVIGWLVERRLPGYPLWWGGLANVVGGIGVVYLFGIPVFAVRTGTSLRVAATASMAFLVGDAVKVVIATAVASAVHRGHPGITGKR
jgi:biotin transport system substrate-specific component